MLRRIALPHAFTAASNPKRSSPLSEPAAKKAATVRLYESDWEKIKDLSNRSDIIRDAVREYLRRLEAEGRSLG